MSPKVTTAHRHFDTGSFPKSGQVLRTEMSTVNAELQVIRQRLSQALNGKVAQGTILDARLPDAPPVITVLKALKLGDIAEVEIRSLRRGELSLELHPSPQFPERDTTEWLAVSSGILRDFVARNIEHFSRGRIGLRQSHGPKDHRLLETQAEILVRDGASFAQSCEVTVTMRGVTNRFLCLEVCGGVSRWGDKILETEARLGERLGMKVHLIPGEFPEARRRERVSEGLSQNPLLKGVPKFLKEHDDPKSKILHHPVDLRSLQWWAYDNPNVVKREDIQALFQTPAGPYVLVAVPTRFWSDRFHRDEHSRVIFCGALVGEDGSLSRMRVGEGLVSEPGLIDKESLRRFDGNPSWELFVDEMNAALRPRIAQHVRRADACRYSPMVAASMGLSQEVLISCLNTRAAPFLAWERYSSREPQIIRGDELVAGDHLVPLKAQQAGGNLNQEQLLRALGLRAPLPMRRFIDYLEANRWTPPQSKQQTALPSEPSPVLPSQKLPETLAS